MTVAERFARWFEVPLKCLEGIPDGDGAFVALQVSFALWERLVKSELKSAGIKASPDAFIKQSATHTGIGLELFDKFWGMYRDGIQHYLQPKVFESGGIRYGWEIDAVFGAFPSYLERSPTHKIIQINPWKWAAYVVGEWQKRPDLLEVFESHAFGAIQPEELPPPPNTPLPPPEKPSNQSPFPFGPLPGGSGVM